MKKFLLKLLFNNYERGIINSALTVYSERLWTTKSESVKEDADSATIISKLFDYQRFKDEEPFPLNDLDIDYQINQKYKSLNTQVIKRDSEINDLTLQLLWTERI